MRNKKKTTKEADKTASCYFDPSSNDKRKKLLRKIEKACKIGDRARCYEHLLNYYYNEPYQNDSSKVETTNFYLFLPTIVPALSLISMDYTLEEIFREMNLLTRLYKLGYYLIDGYDGDDIVLAVSSKKDALLIAEKTFELMVDHYKISNPGRSEEQSAREIFIYGNGKYKPWWEVEFDETPSLENWFYYSKKSSESLKNDECHRQNHLSWWLRC